MGRSVGRAIGLDVHRDFCAVAIAEGGVVRSAGRIASPEGLAVFAQSLGREDRVALEVTGSAWEIAGSSRARAPGGGRQSRRDGDPSARAKTDRLDARTLARLLWAGELDAVWMPDEDCRVMRRRLARREQLVRSRAREERDPRRADAPPAGQAAGVGRVRGQGPQVAVALELPVEETETLQSALRHIEFLDARSPRSSG